MPAPTKAQIKPIVEGAFAAKGFTGENAGDLAEVIAEGIAQGLNLFAQQMMVAPGIPAPPPAGPTAAPGMLI
ncbi:hypothetical protein DENIS_2309 [Desulfonema ishimotonii]|uniref:Uncharacterized protein n=1 Tax=Desulfonema ishimotonii TaxID=45657 RepID=A0A401FWN3_9BACT|nr:hypothetical protein [Desulfonema ishimotonii]GBC61349.1 hypothetical protein DENIS_2309 [Desulfonema ishimotonii]